MQPQYLYNATITNVVDGDTVDAVVDLGFTVSTKIRFRLYGVDTPETNSSDAVVRAAGMAAKRFVADKLLDKQVTLRSYKTDKYGRWLAEIFIGDNITINQQLVDENLAVTYFGGAKLSS